MLPRRPTGLPAEGLGVRVGEKAQLRMRLRGGQGVRESISEAGGVFLLGLGVQAVLLCVFP